MPQTTFAVGKEGIGKELGSDERFHQCYIEWVGLANLEIANVEWFVSVVCRFNFRRAKLLSHELCDQFLPPSEDIVSGFITTSARRGTA